MTGVWRNGDSKFFFTDVLFVERTRVNALESRSRVLLTARGSPLIKASPGLRSPSPPVMESLRPMSGTYDVTHVAGITPNVHTYVYVYVFTGGALIACIYYKGVSGGVSYVKSPGWRKEVRSYPADFLDFLDFLVISASVQGVTALFDKCNNFYSINMNIVKIFLKIIIYTFALR